MGKIVRKTFFAAVAALFVCLPASAQTGVWSGELNTRGMGLSLVFNLGEDSSTLDVPDQGAEGLPVSVSRSASGEVRLDVPSIGAAFRGLWTGKVIAGTFTQNGMSLPLTLSPGYSALRRPQTPVGPFPYAVEAVTFTNGDAVLSGTLSLPEGYGRQTPVLVMVTGSGLQNRDEELFGHKPFAVIADAFARAGIATLRYDDRGFGESTGDVVFCTTEDLKNDALAGVKFLRERFDKVGVIGHSEGGSIALMLASEGEVDFAISLAGMAVSGAETLAWQNRMALLAAGIGVEATESYCRLLSDAFEATTAGLPLPSAEGRGIPAALEQNYSLLAGQLETPYFRRFIALDVSKGLGSVKCPVMALGGTKDTQVECGRNLSAIREKLPADSSNVVKEESGLNHIFQHCNTGQVSEYKQIEETFSEDVISEMIGWIANVAE